MSFGVVDIASQVTKLDYMLLQSAIALALGIAVLRASTVIAAAP